MAHLSICVLGTFGAAIDGEPVVGFESDKVRALLAFLAVEGDRPHRREALAGLLWPESPERRARHNLSQALSNLRSGLGSRKSLPSFIRVSAQTLRFEPQSDHSLDVHQFSSLLAECEAHGHPADAPCQACAEKLGRTIALCRGEFMEGFSLPDAAPFEEWCLARREQVRREVSDVLARLCHYHFWRGDLEQALDYARRHVVVDPLDEAARRQLMLALSAAGRHSQALVQYESCRDVLEEELGIEPSAATTSLYEQIRDRDPLLGRLWRRARRGAGARHAPSAPQNRPPFVARESELECLSAALSASRSGRGQVMFVTGEAGTGKTALLREFAGRAERECEDLIVLSGSCNAYTGVGDPYLPFREILGQLACEPLSDVIDTQTNDQDWRIGRQLPLVLRLLADVGRNLIGTLLSQASFRSLLAEQVAMGQVEETLLAQASQPSMIDPRQRVILSQYVTLLTSLANASPLLILLDDLQWIDSGSIELLLHLARRLDTSRIMVVGAYRPSDAQLRSNTSPPLSVALHEIARCADSDTIELGERPGRAFVDALIDSEPNRIDESLRDAITQRTHGQALFTVELIHDMRARGVLVQDSEQVWIAGPEARSLSLPSRVESVIAGRLERLTPELLRIMSVASVTGEVFSAEVIACAQGTSKGDLLTMLGDELQRRHRLLQADGMGITYGARQTNYRFAHILFQRYCYRRLSEGERVHLHGQVARAIEEICGEHEHQAAPALAMHYERAMMPEKAVHHLQLAAEHAVRLASPQEAIGHVRKALTVLETMPPGSLRDRREMPLQMILATALGDTGGHGIQASGRAYARCRDLGQQFDPDAQLFSATFGLCRHRMNRGELGESLGLANECLAMAKAMQRPGLRLQAHIAVATTQQWRGAFEDALQHFQQACLLYDPQEHRLHAFTFGQEPGVVTLTYMALTLWYLGYPDRAMQQAHKGLDLARQLDHPVSLAFALTVVASLYHYRREPQRALPLFDECIALCKDQGFAQWLVIGEFLRRSCRVQLDPDRRTVVAMAKGLEAILGTGTIISRLRYLGLLAEAHKFCGQVAEGLEVLDRATELLDPQGERMQEADLYRLRGELLWMNGGSDAEFWLGKAITLSQRQASSALELRASVSLARMLAEQGREREATDALLPVYQWFTEGLDTPDLVSAHELLASLAR